MPLSEQKTYTYCKYGYRAFQAGRIVCGDVTALAEIIAEAAASELGEEVARELAKDLAEGVWETCESPFFSGER